MKRTLLMASALLAMTACSIEDEGNYSYTELNSITIEGIETSYPKLYKVDNNLTISPQLTGSLDNTNLGNYEYHWFICKGLHEHTTISREKDLHWDIANLPPGSYTIWLSIKDKATELEWLQKTTLLIETSYDRGFLLLGDDENGEVRLDMITMLEKDTIVIEKVYENPQRMINANKIIFTGAQSADGTADDVQSLYLISEDGSMKLTSSSTLAAEKDYPMFTNIGYFDELGKIITTFDIKRPMIIQDMFPRMSRQMRCRRFRGFITEDYITIAAISKDAEIYSSSINRYSDNSETLFKPYPLAFMMGASGVAGTEILSIFYDMDANRFVKIYHNPRQNTIDARLASYCEILWDYPNDPFQWNAGNQGRTIVYGENGYDAGGGHSYAIMKEIEQEGKYYIYRFIVDGVIPHKDKSYSIDLSKATDFDKASHYAFSSVRTAVLYSVGSTLYAYDYARGQFTSMDLGAEITCLEAEYQSSGSIKEFIVATFDDAAQKGTVRKLEVSDDNNAIDLTEKPNEKWDITLKVKDIEWKYSN